jgi:hypothetical protein
MAGRINNSPPQLPFWPWPRNVREKLVERAQLDRTKKKGKKGDPKNPPLASAALLEFMGPGHSSEELRLPPPPDPRLGLGNAEAPTDLPALSSLIEKADGGGSAADPLARAMGRVQADPRRMEQLKGLLSREAGMLKVMGRLQTDLAEIQRRMKDEQKTRGY